MERYMVILLLLACNLLIALSFSPSSVSHFQCRDNTAGTPKIKTIIQRMFPLKPWIPTAIGISAVECAALCVRTQFNACQSYSYDPSTASCFTRNNTRTRNGIICGIKIDEARRRCRGPGDALFAYGGENKTIMECVCGGDSTGWLNASQYSVYSCVDACMVYPCAIDMFNSGCEVCDKPMSTCVSGVSLRPGTRLVCITLP